jgi:HNH endonuclease
VTYVPAALHREVIERAGSGCEYCVLPSEAAFFPHEVDHVIAEKHGGATYIENLTFACWRCKRHKGTAGGESGHRDNLLDRLMECIDPKGWRMTGSRLNNSALKPMSKRRRSHQALQSSTLLYSALPW